MKTRGGWRAHVLREPGASPASHPFLPYLVHRGDLTGPRVLSSGSRKLQGNETWQGGSKEGVSAPAGLPRAGMELQRGQWGPLWSGAGTSGQVSPLGVEGASLVLNLEANHPANRKDVLPSLDQRCFSLATGLGGLPTFSRWGKWGTPKPQVLMASSAS